MPLKCFKQKSQIIEFKWESMWLLHIKDSYTIDKQTGNKDNSCVCMLSQLSSVQLLETPWIVASQAPLSMGFSRQEYWRQLPFPASPELAGGFCTTEPPGKLRRYQFSSVQLLSCVRLYDLMNHSTPGLPVHHQLPEFTQTHAHRVGDAIRSSHPLSSPSSPAPNPSQHQGLFQWVNSSHEVAKVLEFQLQHQSFQWTPRTDLF